MAKIKFLGCGSAFTTQEYYQSNAIITANSGKKMLIDCGTDIRFSMAEAGLSHRDIDAIYVTHLHADHVGGMEWVAFLRHFDKGAGDHPTLYAVRELMKDLWDTVLAGGLDSIEGKIMSLTDYFTCIPIVINDSFRWEGIIFTPVQTVHVMAGYKIKHSYGLLINPVDTNQTTFFTADTQFCPNQIRIFYSQSKQILHDCETSPFKSSVHAHYDDLKSLPDDVKAKMWLYHYQPKPKYDAKADGFAGFVTKGQEFDL